MEDEDDDEEDDLNLVNPKFSKNPSTQNKKSEESKRLKKQPSGTENKGTNENKKTKMKYWKFDFFRDQDRDKMEIMKKKLTKMRKKTKSSSNVRKIISSQSKVSHKNTSSSNKVSNRKNSKKLPYGTSGARHRMA